ncbi:MAG: DNA internalization-related competence protein ComEC/Rec2 [Methylotenera sp.]|uniref:DNA internalization-related competence protein ComEC/Rec2 n=1 Tax=Methylotenera sp. TaxID=2051956 RepID=UPI00271CBAC3|nr:DNA internalization-related competence protein ComEC/Rec2 [Methylotenera sp.]MDO9151313.1 DNA internalization-related competence protein ComEC/Rec2 [Methylotenera sp.]
MILFALGFVLGAFILQQMPFLPDLIWSLSVLPLFFIHVCLRHAQSRFVGLFRAQLWILIALILGFFWSAAFATYRLAEALPVHWQNKPIELVGVVASVPVLTEHGTRFNFAVEHILTADAIVPEHLSLSIYRKREQQSQAHELMQFPDFKAGQRLRVVARLKRPHSVQNPHGFDFESWSLAENIRAIGNVNGKPVILDAFVWRPQYVVERTRQIVKQRIAKVLMNKPYSGVVQALVMGDDSQISVKDWQLFLRTGITHLMSISGLHITMLSGLMFVLVNFVWRRIPNLSNKVPTRKAATFAGLLTALIYALVAGFSVPTQRTLYMLMVFGVALWSGRRFVIAQVLALALVIVVLIDPWSVISAGFWLSFGAVALLSFAMGARIATPHWLKVAVQTQWAVTIGMLPLLLIMFHQASIISPVANAIAIPLISFFVTPLALLGSFLPIDWPLHLAYYLLERCVIFLDWLNQLPVAVWQQHAPTRWTLAPAVVGVVWMLLPRGVPLRWLGVFGFLPMILISPSRPALGDMKATILDVGQGLSVVVQTSKHTLLYDAGAKFNAQSDAGSRVVVPFLQGEGVQKLDGFIVTHDDNDHSGGMGSVLTLMPVDWFASSIPQTVTIPPNVERMKCYAGQSWHWDGVDFEMLYPNLTDYDNVRIKDNDRSCVLKITSESGSLLLTGDIERNAESALISENSSSLPAMLKSDVLVVPHHGSKTSSTQDFVEAVAPSVVIFTVGYLNRFKHPRPEVIARYKTINSNIYQSDYHGAIELNFNKQGTTPEIAVRNWRAQRKRYWHDAF